MPSSARWVFGRFVACCTACHRDLLAVCDVQRTGPVGNPPKGGKTSSFFIINNWGFLKWNYSRYRLLLSNFWFATKLRALAPQSGTFLFNLSCDYGKLITVELFNVFNDSTHWMRLQPYRHYYQQTCHSLFNLNSNLICIEIIIPINSLELRCIFSVVILKI